MILIITHVHADLDGFASMIGARHLYPGAILSLPGSPERSVRELLSELDASRYNIVDPKEIRLAEVERLVVVDTRQAERLGCFTPLVQEGRIPVEVHDHHPAIPGQIPSSGEASRLCGANASLMALLLKEAGIRPDPEEATILVMGIYEDTGALTYVSTRPEDFEAAGWLRSLGADLPRAGRIISRQLNSVQVRLLGELLTGLERLRFHGVAVGIALAHCDGYVEDLSVLAQRLLEMERQDALFVLVEMQGRLYLVGRSRRPEAVDVGRILARFGGGGHGAAAFASLRGRLPHTVRGELIDLLASMLESPITAREMMSHPVKVIAPAATVDQGRALLTRYTLRALPVLDGERLVGLITRNTLEKAAFHGLAHEAVSEFMVTDVQPVDVTDRLPRIKQLLVEERQVFVPVLEEGRLVGCITRTDLFRILEEEFLEGGRPLEEGGRKEERGGGRLQQELATRLPTWLYARIRAIGEAARRLSMRAFLVGGMVRDLLLGRPNLDVDVVVEGDGIRLAQALAEETPGTHLRFHKFFGTATLLFPPENGSELPFKVDVASARLEHYREPAALPMVEHGSIGKDLARRDFTINAMAIRLDPEAFGQLVDVFNGRRDLKDRLIRVLHNLSFVEDPTRILRAVRFEGELGFHLPPHSKRLLDSAVRMEFLLKLSGKRLFAELKRLLEGPDPVAAIRRLAELGLLRFIHPDLALGERLERLLPRVREALAWRRMEEYRDGEEPETWAVYLLALYSFLGHAPVAALLSQYELSARWQSRLQSDLVLLPHAVGLLTPPGCGDWELFLVLEKLSPEGLILLLARLREEESRRRVIHYWREQKGMRPQVDGDDLLRLGLTPGPVFRRILEEIHRLALEGGARTRKAQLRYLGNHRRRWLAWQEGEKRPESRGEAISAH